jgi:hypothetical protein
MDDLYGVDPQTLGLMIQMQLEDLEEMAQANISKGKGRAGEHDARTDLIVAIDAYNADLTATAQSVADEAMCRSIANAVEADADLIGAALWEEDQVVRDRNLALALRDQSLPADTRRDPREGVASQMPSNMSNSIDEDMLERLRALNLSPKPSFTGVADALFGFDFEGKHMDRGESSSWAQGRRPPARTVNQPVVRRTCTACTDQHPVTNLIRSPSCGHEYCRDCLTSLFTASFTDETLFPPKCCQQPIPVEECRRFLTPGLIAQFNAKKIEFDTPNRTYCHRQACSAFVPSQFIFGHVARCSRVGCSARTCTVCKGAAHTSSDCPQDPATQDLLLLAAAEGWQRCRSCRRFVELDTGCNHISESQPTYMVIVSRNMLTPYPSSLLTSLPLWRRVLLRVRRAVEDLCVSPVGGGATARPRQPHRGPRCRGSSRPTHGTQAPRGFGGTGPGQPDGEP